MRDQTQTDPNSSGILAPSKPVANRSQADALTQKEASKKSLSTSVDRHRAAVAQAVTTPNTAQKNEGDLPAITLSHG